MINLIILKNPFSPQNREIKQVDYIPGQPVFHYIQPEMFGHDEVVISRNGQIVPTEEYHSLVPMPGDYLAVCPVIAGSGDTGKDIARAIAMIGLAIVSMGVGSVVAQGAFWGPGFVGAAQWGWGSYLAAAATWALGGWLINKAFPPAKEEEPKPAYDWSQRGPITTEGNAVPITFGKVRMGVMAPIQILSQRVTTNGEKNYLHLLMSGGEEVDSITDITVNDQPVENFPGIKIEKRYGTNDQTVIPGFDDTWEETSVNIELTEGAWVTRQTVGNAGSGLELTFSFPMGLYYRDDKGKLLYEWVRIQPEYRKVGESDWKPWPNNVTKHTYSATYVSSNSFRVVGRQNDVFRKYTKILMTYDGGTTEAIVSSTVYSVAGNYTTVTVDTTVPASLSAVEVQYIEIDRKKNSPFNYVTRADNLGVGQYEIRCRIVKEGTGDNRTNTTYWSTITHIIYDDFIRPGKSLLAIKALATDRLSGSLRVAWTQERTHVWVWNPYTGQYEQKRADNPAWACYDLIHRCKRIKNIHTGQYEFVVERVPASRIDYQSFADWAAFCEERELYYNGIIYTTQQLWDALKSPEAAGRGKVLMRGTRYSCTCDAPSQPVQMFTVANVALDSFKEEFLGQADRANALEIHFFNIDKNYQEDYIVVYGDDYDQATAISNPTQVTVDYAMTLEQAYRAGKYQLRLNKYLTRIVSWEADIDAIACQVGDVVLLQHDVPQWGIGGRVVEATATTVTLDQEVTLEPGTEYGILVRLADDTLVQKAIAPVEETTTTDMLTVTEPYTTLPQAGDMFSFGLFKKEAKPFRLTYVSRDGDLRRRLVALEYNEAVYEEAEDIPEIEYHPEPPIFEVAGLHAAEETFRQRDGTVVSTIRVAWYDPPRRTKADEYYIFYSYDGGETWEWAGSSTINEFRIMGVKTLETYIVKVRVRVGPGFSDGAISNEVYIYGKDLPPSNVEKMTLTQTGSKIVAAITPVPDPDIRGYEIRMGPSWENSLLIVATDQPKVEFEAPNEGSLTFWVKAVDNSGNYSETATKAQINVFGIPPKNIIYDSDDDKIWSDTRTWRARNGTMYLDPWGRWKIQSKEKVRDYPRFFDIFASPKLTFEDNPELYLPVADLGPNIIEEGYFWVDRFGETHLNSVKKLRDFERFFDIFGVEHELVEPKYATQTLMGIEIYYNQTPDNRVDIEYRTRVDGDGWTEWKTYLEKTFFGRRIEVKLKPYTGNGENVVISGGRMIVDVPDVEEIIENIDIPAEKTRITFRRKFFGPPKSIAIFAADITGKQAIWRIDPESITRDGFDLELLDDEGNLIAGKLLRASVRGY